MKAIITAVKQDIKANRVGIMLCFVTFALLQSVFHSVCFSVILTGMPCPACGITRATLLLFSGQFEESLSMHPLLIFAIFGISCLFYYKYVVNKPCNWIKTYAIIVLVLFLVFYVYRIIVDFPNKEPMLYQQDNMISKILKTLKMLK